MINAKYHELLRSIQSREKSNEMLGVGMVLHER